MLSRASMVAPQCGHADRGATIDSLRGTRWITTERKDPNTKPKTAKMTARAASMAEAYRGGWRGADEPLPTARTLRDLVDLEEVRVLPSVRQRAPLDLSQAEEAPALALAY